jgi:hypothetical protein
MGIMGRTSHVALGALALALGVAAAPASAASTDGWSQADASAGKIREFQTKLMVATLRCHAAGFNIQGSYNRFVAADRDELAAANMQLKTHFMASGPVAGQRDYDKYTTALANSYGDAASGPGTCRHIADLAEAAAAAHGHLGEMVEHEAQYADSAPVDDRPAPQAYADRGPPPRGYYDQAPPPRYRDEWQARQAYYDQAPPRGYYDQGPPRGYYDQAPPPRYRDEWQSQQAYNGPPGYDDRGPPPGYGYGNGGY